MSSPQVYSLLYVTRNNALLSEEGSITINRASNSQPVNTVPKGYAGESPGAPMTEFQVTNAVPASGMEFDAGANIEGLIPAEMGAIRSDGKQLKVKGFIISDSIKHSVNSEVAYDFNFRGGMAQWK